MVISDPALTRLVDALIDEHSPEALLDLLLDRLRHLGKKPEAVLATVLNAPKAPFGTWYSEDEHGKELGKVERRAEEAERAAERFEQEGKEDRARADRFQAVVFAANEPAGSKLRLAGAEVAAARDAVSAAELALIEAEAARNKAEKAARFLTTSVVGRRLDAHERVVKALRLTTGVKKDLRARDILAALDRQLDDIVEPPP